MRQARNALVPEHGEVRRHHLGARRQVQPDLEQLQRIGRIAAQQRKHLRVLYALAGGEPLHIAATKARGSAQRVAVIDQSLAHQRHGLEATVRMAGKARHASAVVHGKAVLAAEVAAHLAAFEFHGLHAQPAITGRIGVVMVGAEQKRIHGGPQRAQRLALENGRH